MFAPLVRFDSSGANPLREIALKIETLCDFQYPLDSFANGPSASFEETKPTPVQTRCAIDQRQLITSLQQTLIEFAAVDSG